MSPLSDRRNRIAELLSDQGFADLQQICEELGVSESTARRDLDWLEEEGILKRTRGGAVYQRGHGAMPAFEDRAHAAKDEKQAIARAAAKLVQDGEAVLLDGGTTTYELARQLLGRELMIVTNSLPIANMFASRAEAELILVGGYTYPKTGVTLGPVACETIRKLHVQHTFLSVGGIDAKGLYNSNLLLVESEQAMFEVADSVTVVADHTKFGHTALAHLSALERVDRVVTDKGLADEYRAMVTGAGVELVIADSETKE